MCFSYDAQPPNLPFHHGDSGQLPPGISTAGGVASARDLVLTSQDGTRFAAYIAMPLAPSGAGIVILPDVRGLFAFYKDLAERFATAGVEAIALDYFGRTAGITARGEDFDYMPHVMQTQPEQITQDVAAAIASLKAAGAEAPRAVFTVGFCFGGSNSFLQAASQPDLAGVIGFYGPPVQNRRGGPAPIDRLAEYTSPVLGLFGGDDQGIPVSDVKTFEDALQQAGIEHEIVVYPGTPHSFFDRKYAEYAEQSANAWMRMLHFIGAHTPQPAA
jgi:carboxymethylenebutenolidase